MPNFDTYNDPKRILTVHDRLELALGEREKNTLEEWQKDTPEALQDNPVTGILSCPTEILDRIFQHVSANHDLAQLCKVNKRFFASALVILYKTLHVPIRPMIDPGVLRMLTRENTGMRYVRYVYAYPCKVGNGGASLLHQCVNILVNQLPQNQLRSFHWLDREPVPARVMTTLWQRQRHLRNIEIIPEADHYLRHGRSEHRGQLERLSLPDLKAVHAVLKGYTTVRNANIALKHGKVVDLKVDALFWIGADPHEHNPEPDDTNPNPDAEQESEVEEPPPFTPDPEFPVIDLLTQNLFRHLTRLKPGYTPPFDQITSLSLKDVNLTLSKHTWFTYLNFRILERLSVKYCEGADLFLLQLADCFPKLESFDLAHRLNDQSDRTIHAIEEVLSHVRGLGLRDLKLCLRNALALPSILPIVKHRDTLERLQIDVAEKLIPTNRDTATGIVPGPQGYQTLQTFQALQSTQNPRPATLSPKQYGLAHLVYQPKDFDLLIKSCSRLRELSIVFPAYNLFFARLGLDPEEHQNSAFHIYLNIVVKNLRLCTLNIVNWPQSYKWLKSDGYYKAKNASLARLAAVIFKRHRTYDPETEDFDSLTPYSPLDIVSFGINELISPGMTAPRAAHFLQSTFDAREGLKGFAVQQVSELELRKRALDIGVLDYGVRDFDKASRKHSTPWRPQDLDSDDSE